MGTSKTPNGTAPPPYTSQDTTEHDLSSQTRSLNLSGLDQQSTLPTPDKTIAHLKLLHAIQTLRNDISSANGLYGLNDNCALSNGASGEARAAIEAKLSEKRWAVFVTKAVDRFTVWWDILARQYDAQPLKLQDMHYKSGTMAASVEKTVATQIPWDNGLLPPLGRSPTTCV